MSLVVAFLCGALIGIFAFSLLVCGWALVLLLHILEELRCIEQLLRPIFYRQLGLPAPGS